MPATIPLTVLTGFLGAGKTTLLNHLVPRPELAGCAVLINEFGEVGIDHLLVEKLDDNLVLMESGCLCCTVRGDLTRSLRDLFMRAVRRDIPPLSRIIVETTGLADPAPVIYTLIHDFFIAERFRLDGIVTAVDTIHAEQQLTRQFEAVKQVAMADRLLLTKCDLASPEQIERIERRLARLNPGAPRIRVKGGRVDPADLLACGLYDPVTKSADVDRWLAFEATAAAVAHEGHGHDVNRHGEVESFALRFAQPVRWGDFSTALDMLQTTVGERILRAKGIVNVAGEAAPRVVQCVHHERYPDAALPDWPDDDHSTRLVFIVRGLPRSLFDHAFASFCAP
jgi:G3E family GTPase